MLIDVWRILTAAIGENQFITDLLPFIKICSIQLDLIVITHFHEITDDREVLHHLPIRSNVHFSQESLGDHFYI